MEEEEEKEEELKELDDSGCCFGWLGFRVLIDKFFGLFVEDLIPTMMASMCISCENLNREGDGEVHGRKCEEAQHTCLG